ncbi:hypothetical protein [Saccharothrix texasensis]|uniref:Uncharacterized protein n=1 Tax=Saccharothrix texasensis TaxID=103734 RepID=A0A3N1HIL0_9PSEU|nr:hypothetical protein [Saccharothrix texasensis]ROP42367.1 hypothetical protein EDD40_7866 [Saccharothrix texasensis]
MRRRAVIPLAAAVTAAAVAGLWLGVLRPGSPEVPGPGSCDAPPGQASGPVAGTSGRGDEYWSPERMSSAGGAPIPGRADPGNCR